MDGVYVLPRGVDPRFGFTSYVPASLCTVVQKHPGLVAPFQIEPPWRGTVGGYGVVLRGIFVSVLH